MKFKKLITTILTAVTLTCVTAFSVSATEYSILDVTDIQKHLAGLTLLSEEKQQEYDFNKDEQISVLDATYLQKMLVEVYEQDTTQSITDDITAEQPTTAIVTEPTAVETTAEPATEPTTVVYPSTLTLNKTELALGIGEKYTLVKSTDISDYPFVFASSNEAVATVDNDGTISAVACGTAEITCTTENGLSAICTVTVGNMAQSITLNQTSFKLGVGETFDLNSYIPENTTAYFRWYTSSNPDVATVMTSGGLVTAKAVGTTTITCKMYNGVTATCTLTVKEAPTSATLSISSKTLKVGEDYIISESTNVGSYSYNFTWSSSNTKVATIAKTSGNKAKISPKMQGTTTITFKTYNGKTAICKITVKGSKVKCLDVSYAQGNIDFQKVKSAGYNYVIIRAGYGKETYQKDEYFEQNYKNAKAAGLKVGVYWFSYAMSPEEALKEAKACLYCIDGKDLDLPVYYDMEYAPAITQLSSSTYTKMATNFCNTIENAGYNAGVYASASVYGYPLKYDIISKDYSIWNAEWNSYYTVNCDIWQYSDQGSVDGISENVDMNYIYNLNILQ